MSTHVAVALSQMLTSLVLRTRTSVCDITESSELQWDLWINNESSRQGLEPSQSYVVLATRFGVVSRFEQTPHYIPTLLLHFFVTCQVRNTSFYILKDSFIALQMARLWHAPVDGAQQ